MQINTKAGIKDLAGKDILNKEEVFTIGEAVANILINSELKGVYKTYVLAKKFYNDKKVELDEADVLLVKEAVEASKSYTVLVKGQLLEVLEVKEK